MHLDPQRIRDAQSLLARHFGPTRIARAASLSSENHDLFLKIETELPTGSFKVRGAIYSLAMRMGGERLTNEPDGLTAVPYVRESIPEPLAGDGLQAVASVSEVVCASTGNHGAAVAYAARTLGCAATIFLPLNPNPVKAARIRDLGAQLVESGADLSAAIDAAQTYARRAAAFFLHDASDPDVPIGTATIGMEIVDALPDVDAIYVPMGDTALIRGVASAAKQRRASIRIVGVVAEQAPAYRLSWEKSRRNRRAPHPSAGQPQPAADDVVETATCDTIADGLAIRRPLAANVAAIRDLVDEVVAVSEGEMLAAIRALHEREQVLAEPAGAAAAAALLKSPMRGRTIVVLVTGGNIAPDIRERALAATA